MWTRSFALGALDRAVKSFAQSLIVLWSADEGFNVLEITAGPTFGVAVGAAVLSLLTSIASSPVGDPGSTSLIPGAD
ncbi:MAG: holin [Actinomycetota bacterium]|nr:holin [Actinomycetota bacterium]